MSSILKALKKVERDNAAHKGVVIGTSSPTQGKTTQPLRRSFLKSPLAILLLLFIGAAGGYLIQKYFEKPALPPNNAPISTTAQTPLAAPATQTTFTNRTSSDLLKSNIALPANAALPVTVQPAISSAKPPLNRPDAPAAKPAAASKPIPQRISDAAKASTRAISQPKQAESLTVNGLALSDGEKRQAIVNGSTVTKGSYIGGARVEEILQNRVRFRKGGKTFEISVGDTGP